MGSRPLSDPSTMCRGLWVHSTEPYFRVRIQKSSLVTLSKCHLEQLGPCAPCDRQKIPWRACGPFASTTRLVQVLSHPEECEMSIKTNESSTYHIIVPQRSLRLELRAISDLQGACAATWEKLGDLLPGQILRFFQPD